MSELCLLAASLIVGDVSELKTFVPDHPLDHGDAAAWEQHPSYRIKQKSHLTKFQSIDPSGPEFSTSLQSTPQSPSGLSSSQFPAPQWSQSDRIEPTNLVMTSIARPTLRPSTGSQLYEQRWAALRSGRIYTRLPANSFYEDWINAAQQPTYEQWVSLLSQEANALAAGQGSNHLTIMLGDSLSLWFPPDHLSGDRLWLNQGISGETTSGMLQRLHVINTTRPDKIHVMVGINDLRHGASDQTVLNNLRQIMRQLRIHHPQAQISIHSILPTRLPNISTERIQAINAQLAEIAWDEHVLYVDLQTYFTDAQGELRQELTTDGLHLNANGYAVWEAALRRFNLV